MGLNRGLKETFEKFDDDYLNFDLVPNKLSNRSDLHAFMMLDKLVPDTTRIVSASGHDEIFLEVDLEKFAEVAIEEDILNLIRSGVRYSDEFECLCMFV